MIARRSLLGCWVSAAVLSRAGSVAAGPVGPTVLQLSIITASSAAVGLGAAAFAAEVARRTEGRIRIELYPSSELGMQEDLVGSIMDGSLDMLFVTGSVIGSFTPSARIFDIPFLFRDVSHARAVIDGPIGVEAIASILQRNVVGLAWGENGPRHVTTVSRPVRTVADLAGMKLRIPASEVMATAFKALGADPKAMPINELYAALANGTVDGQENPIATMMSVNVQHVQKHITLTAHVYSPALLTIRKSAFDRFSAADQQILRDAAKIGGNVSREMTLVDERNSLEKLQEAGMQVTRDYDRASFVSALAAAEPTFAKLFGKDRLDTIRNTKS